MLLAAIIHFGVYLVAETSSQSSAFLGSTVRAVIEVETQIGISAELEQKLADAVWRKDEGHGELRSSLDQPISSDLGLLGFSPGHLEVRSDAGVLHVEVSTDDATVRPPAVYEMAARVQALLGGGGMKWAVAVSPPPVDQNLRHYFRIMGDLSDHKELIARKTSIYAAAEIWRINGATSMFLNDIVMSDTRDEASYHEMLVHPGLLSVELPLSVLIIGGGEGATLREVLRDTRVENVTMVDIDQGLVELCRDHLHVMHQGSFGSSKASIVYADGIEYLQSVKPGTYDVIIVDGIDVTSQYKETECVSADACRSSSHDENVSKRIGTYGDTLFTVDFYVFAHAALRTKGALVQYISDVDDDTCEYRLFKAGFNESVIYSVGVDSFHGQGASFVVAAKGFGSIFERVERGVLNSTHRPKYMSQLKYVNASTFNESFTQERTIRRLKGGGGRHGRGGANAATPSAGVCACCLLFWAWLTKSEELERDETCRIRRSKDEISNNAEPSKQKSFFNKKGKEVGLGSATEAARSIDNDFGSWGRAAGALYIGHLCWLLKEVFWIFLIPYAAYFFGLLSLMLFLYAICLRAEGGEVAAFYHEAPVELLINVIQVSWQIWNCLLMVADFTWDVPGEVPGYAEDLVNLADCEDSCEDEFDAVLLVARLGLAFTFSCWLIGSILLLWKWLTPPNLLSQGYSFQTCLLQGGWLAFWVLKDFIWTFEEGGNVPFAITAYAFHLGFLIAWLVVTSSPVILVDGLDDEELDKLSASVVTIFDRVSISYVLWSLSSLLWFLCEDAFDGELSLRYIAASLCGVSFFLYLSGYPQVKAKSRANDIFIQRMRNESVGKPPDDMQQALASSDGKLSDASLVGKVSDDNKDARTPPDIPGKLDEPNSDS